MEEDGMMKKKVQKKKACDGRDCDDEVWLNEDAEWKGHSKSKDKEMEETEHQIAIAEHKKMKKMEEDGMMKKKVQKKKACDGRDCDDEVWLNEDAEWKGHSKSKDKE